MSNFEHVSSNGHQMSLAGGLGGGGLYSEVQCIMVNGHMELSLWTEWRTDMPENITFSQLRWRAVLSKSI